MCASYHRDETPRTPVAARGDLRCVLFSLPNLHLFILPDHGHEDRSGHAGASSTVRTSQGPHRHRPHGNHGSDRLKKPPQAVGLFGPGAFYP
eukprot:scaffold18967_cov63-Phaeocystis_antarctica.AAC.1